MHKNHVMWMFEKGVDLSDCPFGPIGKNGNAHVRYKLLRNRAIDLGGGRQAHSNPCTSCFTACWNRGAPPNTNPKAGEGGRALPAGSPQRAAVPRAPPKKRTRGPRTVKWNGPRSLFHAKQPARAARLALPRPVQIQLHSISLPRWKEYSSVCPTGRPMHADSARR